MVILPDDVLTVVGGSEGLILMHGSELVSNMPLDPELVIAVSEGGVVLKRMGLQVGLIGVTRGCVGLTKN